MVNNLRTDRYVQSMAGGKGLTVGGSRADVQSRLDEIKDKGIPLLQLKFANLLKFERNDGQGR